MKSSSLNLHWCIWKKHKKYWSMLLTQVKILIKNLLSLFCITRLVFIRSCGSWIIVVIIWRELSTIIKISLGKPPTKIVLFLKIYMEYLRIPPNPKWNKNWQGTTCNSVQSAHNSATMTNRSMQLARHITWCLSASWGAPSNLRSSG